MNKAKRVLACFLCVFMVFNAVAVPAIAAERDVSVEQNLATALKNLGLFKGVSDTNFDLAREPTRVEALIMLIRVLGKESEAISGDWSHPFTDVAEWADKYVGYAYENSLTNGMSETEFGKGSASAAMYLTFVLRALGYSDSNGDFTWSNPFDLAKSIGILSDSVNTTTFWRADVVRVSYAALSVTLKGSDQTLAEKLIEAGVFTKTQFDAYYNVSTSSGDKAVLTSEQIYASCSPAVFYIELYNEFGMATNTGSGFFIDSEGTAVTNYHVIEGAYSAKVTLASGEIHLVLGVYDYSAQNDWAVIKVDGSGFPYLKQGDISGTGGGAAVYAIGSPLGLQNTITEGIVSNPSRQEGKSTYIQTSAAVSTGSSGGALIDKYGEVVGIITAMYLNGQNLNLALPISYIKNASKAKLTEINQVSIDNGHEFADAPDFELTDDLIKNAGMYVQYWGEYNSKYDYYYHSLFSEYDYEFDYEFDYVIKYYPKKNRLELCMYYDNGEMDFETGIYIDEISDTYEFYANLTGSAVVTIKTKGKLDAKTFNDESELTFDNYSGGKGYLETFSEMTLEYLTGVLVASEVIFEYYSYPVSIKDFGFEAMYEYYISQLWL